MLPPATVTAESDASDSSSATGSPAIAVTSEFSGCGSGSQARPSPSSSAESESELGRFIELAEAMALPSSEHGLANSLYAPPLYHILSSIESAIGTGSDGKTTAGGAAIQFKG